MEKHLKEHRCKNCRKLFFKGIMHHGTIEIKCKSCKNVNIIYGEVCEFVLREHMCGRYKPGSNDSEQMAQSICCTRCTQCKSTLVLTKSDVENS